MKIYIILFFCIISISLPAQDYFQNINYFNHRQSDVKVDHFNDLWLTSADINDDDIEGLVNRANEKMELGYYTEALSDLDKAIAADSSIAYLYNLRGMCILGTDSVDAAMQDFYQAAILDSSDALSRFYLGQMLVETDQLDSAEILLKKFDREYPDYAIIKYALANVYLADGKIDKAVRYYKRSADIDPEFPEAFYSIGLIKMMMFDNFNAKRFFDKTIKFNPDYAPAHYMLGLMELFQNDSEDALELWNRALTLDPDNSYYRISRGILHLYMEDYHNGIQDLRTVYKENKDGVNAFDDFSKDLFDKSRIDFQTQLYLFSQFEDSISQGEKTLFEEYLGMFLLNQYAEAENLLAKGTIRFNDCALLYFFRGINAEHLRYHEAMAEEYYSEALIRKPFIYAIHLRIGIAQSDLAKYDEAIQNFNRFTEFNDTTKTVYRFRGFAYFHKGEYEAALLDFDNYTSIDSFDMDLTYNKAICYMMLGDYENAVEHYAVVIEHNAYDNEARYQKAECHYHLNEYDSTSSELNQLSSTYFNYHPKAFVLRAKIRVINKQYSEAAYDLNQAILKDPDNLEYLFLYTKVLRALRNLDALIDAYDRMLTISDGLPEIQYLRAMTYFQKGDSENGCAGLDDAAQNGYEQAKSAKLIYCKTEN